MAYFYQFMQDCDFLCSDGPILCSDGVNFTVLGPWDSKNRFKNYLKKLISPPFTKLCRLRFLNPDGSTAYALDNRPKARGSSLPGGSAFISDGEIHVNYQSGQRRTAAVTLSNLSGHFDFSAGGIWFGTEIALDEGIVLDDGTDFYLQQGIFGINTPTENVSPGNVTIELELVDKWSNLDGTLGGNLEETYEVAVGTNIFEPVKALLAEDSGNGKPVDRISPVFTEYYNDKTQQLPDGSTVGMALTAYTLRLDGGSETKADVILGLAGMVNAVAGYDPSGALRIDPSQDDISDSTKPVLWQFTQENSVLLGLSYEIRNSEVYNDYIVCGEQLDDYTQPRGRAQNFDPKSSTNINLIGRKTFRESAPGYATTVQCRDLAEWKLKRATVLQKAVTLSCSQLMHIQENSLVTVVRSDKPGSPVERHLVQGFSRPLCHNGAMTVNAVSVSDFPVATVSDF